MAVKIGGEAQPKVKKAKAPKPGKGAERSLRPR